MSTLPELLSAIAGQLEQQLVGELDTIQVVAGQAFALTPPTVDVYPPFDTFMEQGAFGALNRECRLTVRARVVATDQDNGQALLYQLMDRDGGASVLQALDHDWTFGGACSSSTVEMQTGIGTYTDPASQEMPLVGSEWHLRVIL